MEAVTQEEDFRKKLRRFYEAEGKKYEHHQKWIYYQEASHAAAQERMSQIQQFIDRLGSEIENETVMEIGCAEGWYCTYLAKKARKVIGLDISFSKLERAKKETKESNVLYVWGDWDDLPIAPEHRLGLILATECLEHAIDPKNLLDRLLQLAKYVIVTLPVKEKKRDTELKIQGHLHTFSKKSAQLAKDRLVHFKVSGLYCYAIYKGIER